MIGPIVVLPIIFDHGPAFRLWRFASEKKEYSISQPVICCCPLGGIGASSHQRGLVGADSLGGHFMYKAYLTQFAPTSLITVVVQPGIHLRRGRTA